MKKTLEFLHTFFKKSKILFSYLKKISAEIQKIKGGLRVGERVGGGCISRYKCDRGFKLC